MNFYSSLKDSKAKLEATENPMEIVRLSKERKGFSKNIKNLKNNLSPVLIQSQTPQPKENLGEKES